MPLARHLAKTYGRVLYHTPWESSFPTIDAACIGDGFECIERCQDIWGARDEIDLFVFPDILFGGLQEELRRQGFPVWGSGHGDDLETNRLKFLEVLQHTGLEIPPVTEVRGLTELRSHLADAEDKFIKISKYRGSMETRHWRNLELDGPWLDALAVKLGPVGERLRFLVCDPIDTDIEIGCDTYCIDGQFPSHILEAYEWKDKSAFGAFKALDRAARPVQAVLHEFGPELGKYTYRNYFSAEIRAKGDKYYFLDPCCRGPLPMTWSQVSLYGNWPEIIWAGAHGELVEPEPMAKYTCECAVSSCKAECGSWTTIRVPDELEDHLFISRCCYLNGLRALPPDEKHPGDVGWLVAIGDTPRDTLDRMLELAGKLPDGFSAATESLPDLLEEISHAEEEGMKFGKQPLPRPEEAVKPS